MIRQWFLAARQAWRRFCGTEDVLEEMERMKQKVHETLEESRTLANYAHEFLEAAKKKDEAQRKRAEAVAAGTRDNW